MGTLIIVSACILLAAGIVALGLLARGNRSTTMDEPDGSGITQREWMNMR